MKASGDHQIIFFTGLSGAGKSSVGRELARTLGKKFVDVDERIVAREKQTIKEIFDKCGEESFRAIEAEMIREIISNRGQRDSAGAVVALGGGALLAPDTVEAVKASGTLIYLDVTCEVAAERLRASADRPLALGADGERLSVAELAKRLEGLLQLRLAGYAKADRTITTTSRSVALICQELCEQMAK